MKKYLISILITALLILPLIATACSESDSQADDSQLNGSQANRIAVLETSMGTIKFEIYEDKVPTTAANFISLANSEFYNGLIFHRVAKLGTSMIIQTGDPTGTGTGGSDTTIPLEINSELTHADGAVGMARKSYPTDSATSQFYICDGALPGLDGNYAVFGQVIEGMDVVRAIAAVDTVSEKPVEDVVMTTVTITEQ